MYNIALIGAGRIGALHAANVAAHPALSLTHIVDPVPQAAQSMASQYGAEAASLSQVMDSPDIHGVLIASSTETHLDFTQRAVEAGKAVFCEKPLDLDLDRCRAAEKALEAYEDRIFLAFNRRFDPDMAALHDRISNETAGTLETLHIISHDPMPPAISYLATSGGLFKDMTIHDFDMAHWLMGEQPESIFATTSCLVDPAIAEVGDVDTAKLILRAPSGKLCVISSGRRTGYGYDQRVEAFCSKGLLRVNNRTDSNIEHWHDSATSHDPFKTFFLDRYREAYQREIDHFVDILGGGKPAIGFRDGISALVMAEAAARSAASGRFVRLEEI